MAGDDITNAELGRQIAAMQRDIHEDLSEIRRRMDSYVLREVYAADQRRQEDRMTAIELASHRADERRAADRRVLIGAVVAAVLSLIVQLVLSVRGPV